MLLLPGGAVRNVPVAGAVGGHLFVEMTAVESVPTVFQPISHLLRPHLIV